MPPRPIVASALAATLLFAGTAAARAAHVQVVDDSGAQVRLETPARRIISLAPHLTELLFSAGAGEQLVGVVAYSDHPQAARQLPRVGDSAQFDLERIVALKPELIVAWQSGNPPHQVQRLSALGIPVYRSEPRRLADISSTLRRLGTLAGSAERAQARANAFDRAVTELRTRYAGRPPLRVFYQIWHRPLLTVSGRHLISEALELCGAHNVYAPFDALTPTVDEEAVVALDPDAIVTGSVDPRGPDNLDGWRRLKSLRAVRRDNLVVVDPDTLHRQTERVVDGVRELCEKLDAVRARGLR